MPESPGLLARLGSALRPRPNEGVTLDHGGFLTENEAAAISHAIVTSRPNADVSGWVTAIRQLDIWGPTFRAFMGMGDSGGGVDEIQDDPGSWGRARVAEPYVFRAQSVRSDAISAVPLRCWEMDRNGRRKAIDHPSIDILSRSVPLDPSWDPYVSGMEGLMCYTLLALDNWGRSAWKMAFSNPNASGKRTPTEIQWLVPSAFTPIHGYEVNENVPFSGVYYSTGGQRQRIKPSDLVYFSTPNPADPIAGTSKISVLRNAINLRLYSVRSNYDFFKNSMRPDWILSGDWKNNEENVERIKRSLRRHYTGESNREPLVIGEGATAHLLTTTQKDAEWTSMMRMIGEEISAVYGVPVLYLNNFERATYENAKQARLMLWHDCLIAETRRLANQITRRYLWRFWPETINKNYEIAFDYGAIEGLTEDVGLLWERVTNFQERLQKQVDGGTMTRNQMRSTMVQIVETMGLDATPWTGDLPDGDIYFIQFDKIPSTQASVQALMNIEASRSANPLTGYLIENVPGAPNAGTNAERGQAEIQANQQQLQAQAAQARQQPAQPQQRGFRPLVVKARPAPGPIRDNRLGPVQKRLTAKLKRHFQALQVESLRTLRGTKGLQQKAELYDGQQAKDNLRVILRGAISESAAAAYAASAEDYSLDVNWQDDNAWVADYFGQRLSLIDGIDDTTLQAIRGALQTGAANGETMDQLAERVTAVFSDAIGNRAPTIARTETIQAYGAASLQSYQEAGLTQAQIYDGSDDPECAAVDGLVVSLEEATQLMAQEHPNGTRGVAPVVDTSTANDVQAAGVVHWNALGVAIA